MKTKLLSITLSLIMLATIMPKTIYALDAMENHDFEMTQLDENYEFDVKIVLDTSQKVIHANSQIINVLGKGIDNYGNVYDFDFINNKDRMKLKVGDEFLSIQNIGKDTYGFGMKENNMYPFVFKYFPKTSHNEEYMTLNINKSLTNETPLEFIYSVELTDPAVEMGEYQLFPSSQITLNGEDLEKTMISYNVAYLYTVEHQYYTCTLDNMNPMYDRTIVTESMSADDKDMTIGDLMRTSLNESELKIEENSSNTEILSDCQGNRTPGIPKNRRMRVSLNDGIQYGPGHAYREVDEKLVSLDDHLKLDKNPAKNKIIIKYYRTSYTVDHKYYTSIKGGQYTLDGVVTSKEYTGLEGETINVEDIRTKVKYEGNIYKLYKYSDDIVLQVQPSLNKITIEYRREIDKNSEENIKEERKPSTMVKPVPSTSQIKLNVHAKEVVNTGDHTNIALYVGLCAAAVIGMIVLKKKKK